MNNDEVQPMDSGVTPALLKQHFHSMMNGPVSESLRRQGLRYRVIYGVEWPRLVELAATIPQDHHLAQALWKEDIRECRLMAGLLQPAETFLPELADIWIDSMHYPEEAEMTSLSLFSRVPWASSAAFEWIASTNALRQTCGYHTLARLFMKGDPLVPRSEAEFLDQAQSALSSPTVYLRRAAQGALLKYALTGPEQEEKVRLLLPVL